MAARAPANHSKDRSKDPFASAAGRIPFRVIGPSSWRSCRIESCGCITATDGDAFAEPWLNSRPKGRRGGLLAEVGLSTAGLGGSVGPAHNRGSPGEGSNGPGPWKRCSAPVSPCQVPGPLPIRFRPHGLSGPAIPRGVAHMARQAWDGALPVNRPLLTDARGAGGVIWALWPVPAARPTHIRPNCLGGEMELTKEARNWTETQTWRLTAPPPPPANEQWPATDHDACDGALICCSCDAVHVESTQGGEKGMSYHRPLGENGSPETVAPHVSSICGPSRRRVPNSDAITLNNPRRPSTTLCSPNSTAPSSPHNPLHGPLQPLQPTGPPSKASRTTGTDRQLAGRRNAVTRCGCCQVLLQWMGACGCVGGQRMPAVSEDVRTSEMRVARARCAPLRAAVATPS